MPRTIDDVDVVLESWLEGKEDIPCQMIINMGLGARTNCKNPSNWIAYYTVTCACFAHRSILMCDSCHDLVLRKRVACGHCGKDVVITWMERTR